MRRIETDLDGVRLRALGFVEFQESGVSLSDGSTVALEIEVGTTEETMKPDRPPEWPLRGGRRPGRLPM